MNGPLGPKLYVLEERKLPGGDWYADSLDGSDELKEALKEAADWATFSYEDSGDGQEVRVVVYERREVLCVVNRGD